MNGKLYILGAPPCIFSGLAPELQQRMEYVDNFLHFPKEKWKQLTHALLVGRLPLPRPVLYTWFSRKGLDHLLQATAADRVLLYEGTNWRTLRAIKSLLPAATRCFIYYCNPIRSIFRRPEQELAAIARLGYRLSTFDPEDAARYGLTLTGQYFRYPEGPLPEEKTDCFFCGLPKDRAEELEQLRRLLVSNGWQCRFIIPQRNEQRISYADYLSQLATSRCVIDICQKDQVGLTRRPLEALFYGKKLITNNPKIQEYDFYNSKNIFIFGKNSTDGLNDFLRQPIEPVPTNVKDKYDINGWIRHYLP